MARVALFIVILTLGTIAALAAGETGGLALTNFSGVSIQSLTVTQDNKLYASVIDSSQLQGIYRSKDEGRSWELVDQGPGPAITAIAVHPLQPDVLFVGTIGGPVISSHHLWRSSDGGQSWRKFFLDLPAQPDGLLPAVTALAMDPNQPDMLYVGTDGHGLYQFDVGLRGEGFRRVGDVVLPEAYIKQLQIGPTGWVYAVTNDGLFARSDAGWQQIGSLPEQPVSLAVAPGDPQTLYAGGASNGAYRSTDGGHRWTRISTGLEAVPGAALRVTSLAVDEQDSQHVVLATAYVVAGRLIGRTIYESYDGGSHWAKVGDTIGLVTGLILNQGSIYAATSDGLMRYGTFAELPVTSFLSRRPLANPTVTQHLILILTIVLAGLTLLGRKEWVLGRDRASM